MPTLKELFEGSNFSGSEKTASAQTSSSDVDGMDKLAMQLGLFGETTKVASEKKEDDEKEEHDEKEEMFGEKKASSDFSGSLHSMLFPGSVLVPTEKTASEKEASEERAMGAAAYDKFSDTFGSFVEKLAYTALSGNPHGDAQPVNHMPNNKPASAKQPINTTPQVMDNVKAKNDAETVGHYEQTHVKAASAFRKQLLLAMLDQ